MAVNDLEMLVSFLLDLGSQFLKITPKPFGGGAGGEANRGESCGDKAESDDL